MMSFKLKIISFVFLSSLFFYPFYFSEAKFERFLNIGSTGSDVRDLQIILNRDMRTKVANFGPGSPGQETNYFGPLTRSALIKFQELNRQLILTPLGLISGTGRVDQATLMVLNQTEKTDLNLGLINNIVITPPPPVIAGSNVKKTEKTDLNNISDLTSASFAPDRYSSITKIKSISPTSGRPGTKITIKGEGFSSVSNDVFVGHKFITGLKSADGNTLIVYATDPFSNNEYLKNLNGHQFEVPLGIYLKNSSGVSNGLIFKLQY